MRVEFETVVKVLGGYEMLRQVFWMTLNRQSGQVPRDHGMMVKLMSTRCENSEARFKFYLDFITPLLTPITHILCVSFECIMQRLSEFLHIILHRHYVICIGCMNLSA